MTKNKDICNPPYYCATGLAVIEAVKDHLSIALPSLHSRMLQRHPPSQDGWPAPLNRSGVQLVVQKM